MKAIKKIIILFPLLCMFVLAEAQLPRFSQVWLNPQFTAPSLMGGANDSRMMVHYRHQTLSQEIGFKTFALSGQIPLNYGGSDKPFGVAGVNFIHDEAGMSGLLTTTGIFGTYAYDVALSERHYLLGGIQAGYFFRKIDWTKVRTDAQYQYGTHNPGAGQGEQWTHDRSNAFQANAGLSWYMQDEEGNRKAQFGVGAYNVNRAHFTYLDRDGSEVLPLRLSAFATYQVLKTDAIDLTPMVFVNSERGLYDIAAGTLIRKNIHSGTTTDESHIGMGLFYSTEHTILMAFQYSQPRYVFALSYDLPFGSEINSMTRNAVEATIGLRFGK